MGGGTGWENKINTVRRREWVRGPRGKVKENGEQRLRNCQTKKRKLTWKHINRNRGRGKEEKKTFDSRGKGGWQRRRQKKAIWKHLLMKRSHWETLSVIWSLEPNVLRCLMVSILGLKMSLPFQWIHLNLCPYYCPPTPSPLSLLHR